MHTHTQSWKACTHTLQALWDKLLQDESSMPKEAPMAEASQHVSQQHTAAQQPTPPSFCPRAHSTSTAALRMHEWVGGWVGVSCLAVAVQVDTTTTRLQGGRGGGRGRTTTTCCTNPVTEDTAHDAQPCTSTACEIVLVGPLPCMACVANRHRQDPPHNGGCPAAYSSAHNTYMPAAGANIHIPCSEAQL